ncbi:MAG: antibiotic biosynthesis monooxygenase [Gammaproteobacteria bacterium]|nr:antibiotic biosynthesis monooxygenase [Gammaproteobacteria bacterium]
MFTVIVHFDTTAENQLQALEEIGTYIEDFLSRQDGFLRSRLHRALDGSGLVHYALWRSEDDFRAAGAKAREHPALPGLMQYNPRGQYYDVSREFSAG